MPSLTLLKAPPGASDSKKEYPLDGESSFVLGRDEKHCQIVIDSTAVSRRHAQISKYQGKYFIEDKDSRNGTFVNQSKIQAQTPLKDGDNIKICDFLFVFREGPSKGQDEPEVEEDSADGMTTVQHSAPAGRGAAQQLLEAQTSDKLRALLDISTSLSRTLELEPLLPQIAETLFGVFKQADRCFVIMLDDAGRMIPKVVKSRRPGGEDSRFSRTIVRKCLDSVQSYLSEDASSDGALGAAHSIAEFRIRSVMCVPLVTADGRRLGALQLDTQDVAKKFKDDDLKLLTIVANLATVAVEKAHAHAELVSREKERREIEVARKVQIGFLPKSFPQLPGYEFFAFYSPAMSVGGDYYDFITLPHGRVGIVLGDVAGKGVAAALLMAKLSAEVRYSMLTEQDSAKAISLLSDQLIRGGIGDRFVTLAALIVDPVVHQVTVVNAGHINPMRRRNSILEEIISNRESGLPLGLVQGFEYESKVIQIEEGDTILLFTDGVTDAESPDGLRFGMTGISAALDPAANPGVNFTPRTTGELLIRAVQRHANGREQSDDIALLSFGRSAGSSPPVGSAMVPKVGDLVSEMATRKF